MTRGLESRMNLLLVLLTLVAPVGAWSEASPLATSSPLNHSSYFGINGVGYFHRPEAKKELRARWELMQELGARWDRSDFWWHVVEPQKGQWDFRISDEASRAYRDRDVQMLPILNYGAEWKHGEAPATDAERADWAEYVRHVVTRYRGYVNTWEVWNEPNIIPFWRPQPDPEAYAKLLTLTARTAREANPQVRLIGFTMADLDHEFLERVLEITGPDVFDAVSYHFYRKTLPEERTPDEVNELKLVLEHFGKPACPIWVTEFGVTSHISEGVSEDLQAIYLMRQLLLLVGSGVERVFPFTLVDNASDPGGEWGAQLGLVSMSGRRKPSFHAYKTLIQELDDYKLVGPVYLGDSAKAYLFQRRTNETAAVQHKLVSWSVNGVRDVRIPTEGIATTRTVEGEIESNAPEWMSTYSTMLGEKKDLALFDQYSRLMLSDSPVYVPVRSRALAEDAEVHWSKHPLQSSPNHTEEVRLVSGNGDPLTTTVQFTLPDGWRSEATGAALSFSVPSDAAEGWYSIKAHYPAPWGTSQKELRVWVRRELRGVVRPFFSPDSTDVVTSVSVHNQNLRKDAAWRIVSSPHLEGVTWPGSNNHSSTDDLSYFTETALHIPTPSLRELNSTLQVSFETQLPGAEATTTPAFQIGVIPFRDTAPTIDADLNEYDWSFSMPLGLPHQQTRGNTAPQADSTAVILACATSSGFYIGAEITDDRPMMNNSGTGAKVYEGDGIEVYIGTRGYSGEHYSSKENGYFHFCLTPGRNGTGAAVSDFEKVVPESAIAVKQTKSGYVLEAFIPAKAIANHKAERDNLIAWDVQLNDRDDYATTADQRSYMWNGDHMNWLRAGKWGMAYVK